MELLTTFLQEQDFRALRRDHPALCGGADATVELCREGRGPVTWRVVPPRPPPQ